MPALVCSLKCFPTLCSFRCCCCRCDRCRCLTKGDPWHCTTMVHSTQNAVIATPKTQATQTQTDGRTCSYMLPQSKAEPLVFWDSVLIYLFIFCFFNFSLSCLLAIVAVAAAVAVTCLCLSFEQPQARGHRKQTVRMRLFASKKQRWQQQVHSCGGSATHLNEAQLCWGVNKGCVSRQRSSTTTKPNNHSNNTIDPTNETKPEFCPMWSVCVRAQRNNVQRNKINTQKIKNKETSKTTTLLTVSRMKQKDVNINMLAAFLRLPYLRRVPQRGCYLLRACKKRPQT